MVDTQQTLPQRSWLARLSQIDEGALSAEARYGYIPGLDGLRAIAVLIVMVAHFGLEHLVPGGFGVTVFFFISGFLITRLLIAERESKGKIGLKDFYIRRAVRLYPALLFMVFGTVAWYGLMGYGGPTGTEFTAAVAYFTNIYQVVVRAGGELPFMPWTHLWSLAVEEHFYMVLPLIVLLCRRHWTRLQYILLAVIFIGPLWRLILFASGAVDVADYNYMMTDARFDSLAWGCLLTVSLHRYGRAELFRRMIGVGPVILALAALAVSFVYRDDMFRYVSRFTLQGAAIFVLFLNYYFMSGLRFSVRMMEWAPIMWVGQVSYALYLWHVPVYDMTVRAMGHSTLQILICIAASFAVTAVSFYIVEKPFMALRKKFGSHGKHPAAVSG